MLLASCKPKGRPLPDLTEKYSYTNKKPFGAYTAHSIVESFYDNKFIQKKNQPFYLTYSQLNDTSSVYISISRKFFLTEEDKNGLMQFVYAGNTVFISASFIDSILLNAIGCKQKEITDILPYENAVVSLVKDIATGSNRYTYFYKPFSNYFTEVNGVYCRVMGYNEYAEPNCLVFFWGKGRMILHCDPRAFSNYFLLTKDNHTYMHQYLQLMPADPEHVYWDDYYYRYNYREQKSQSIFSALFKYPPLKFAFLLALALLALYILLNGKRRQRVIPVIEPVTNKSVAFAQVIASLYLTEDSNDNIAQKMIVYFNEYIRSRYFLNAHSFNDNFLLELSRKSGVPMAQTETLFRTIAQAQATTGLDDFQLISLHQQIQKFHQIHT
ncbi:MAG: DUF4350 domain-containing protein [Ferruginibacter sp.]